MRRAKRIITLVIVIVFAACLMLAGCGNNAPANETSTPESTPATTPEPEGVVAADPITWDFLCAWVQNNNNFIRLEHFKEIVERNTEGRLIINILGGPEIIPESEQAEATINGVVDGIMTSCGYTAGYIPAGEVLSFSNMSTQEMQANGGLDFLREAYAAQGLYLFIGDNEVDSQFNIYTNNEITTLAGLKGLKIRAAAGIWSDFGTNVGMVPVPIAFTELYSALEQGLVEGYMAPAFAGYKEGFFEFTQHKIMPAIGRGGSNMVFNLSSWESLPADLQEILKDSVEEIKAAYLDVNLGAAEANNAALQEAGGSLVTFSPEDSKALVDIFNETAWTIFAGNNPGADIDKLKPMFTK